MSLKLKLNGIQIALSKLKNKVTLNYKDGSPSWINDLMNNYNVTSLVDVNGNEITSDFED